MNDLISRKYLYDKMSEKEELARQRVLDTPTHSPAYLRYVAQFNERTALKHEIAEAPTVYAVPLKDVYRIIAGHSDYHGDSILSALQCIAEGKEVKPIKPIEV